LSLNPILKALLRGRHPQKFWG